MVMINPSLDTPLFKEVQQEKWFKINELLASLQIDFIEQDQNWAPLEQSLLKALYNLTFELKQARTQVKQNEFISEGKIQEQKSNLAHQNRLLEKQIIKLQQELESSKFQDRNNNLETN
jgi:hypothetical protein